MKGTPASGKRNGKQSISISTRGHGLRRFFWSTYSSWWAMIDRCYRKTNVMHYMYGSTGVEVCDRWFDFEKFIEDMGERPEGKTLDRFPDKQGAYGPLNCRWATPHEQGVNRKTTKLTENDVQDIHHWHAIGETNAVIARRVGVARCSISLILSGAKWKGSAERYQEKRSHDHA